MGVPSGMECFRVAFFIEFDPGGSARQVKHLGRVHERRRRGNTALRKGPKIGEPKSAPADLLTRRARNDIVCRDVSETIGTARVLTSLPQLFAETGVDAYRLKGVDDGEDDGSISLLDIPEVCDPIL